MASSIDLDYIKRNYHRYSASHFAERFNVGLGYIYSVASQLGVTSNQRWDDDRGHIVPRYLAGESLDQLAADYGHSKQSLVKRLEEWGVQIRSQSQSNRRYAVDESFFETIDTEAKAYWLGFIYADGNVRRTARKWVLQVTLAAKDDKHVRALKRALSSKVPLYDDGGKTKLVINSVKMTEDLIRLGVHPRKSLTLTFPTADQVPDHLIHHFMRGYFDGDGSINLASNARTWGFSVISTCVFSTEFQRRLVSATGFNATKLGREKRTGDGKLCSVVYGGYIPLYKTRDRSTCRVIKLYHYLYRDATVWLPRKRLKFERILTLLYKHDWR